MKATAIILGIVIVVLLGIVVFVNPAKSPTVPSGPQTAESADGHVRVSFPGINEAISSPVTISGTVVAGGWFFEAVFPVKVLDGDGSVIGRDQAHAQGNWMTSAPVPFTATITFTKSKFATGTVLLEKDNPSGLPQNAGELRIPVRFQ